MAIEIVASYSESNKNDEIALFSSQSYVFESFVANGDVLDSTQFYMKKVGAPPGTNVVAYIYAHTGTFGVNGKPTGSPLATSDGVSIASISSSFALVTFTFTGGNKITLSNGTNYCVVIFYNNGDSSNRFNLGSDSSSTYTGTSGTSTDGTTWSSSAATALCFYVYGDVPITGPANLKSLDTNLKANIKSYNTNLIANVKSINTNV